jgi:hypothetical protein
MCRSAQTVPSRFVLSKHYTVSRYTPKFNFSYGLKGSTAFPESIFSNVLNVEQHSVQIYWREMGNDAPVSVLAKFYNF